jgi:acyl carrier protein
LAQERAPGEHQLVAFLTPVQTPDVGSSQMQRFLRMSLPEFMVPAAFVWLDELPLTPAGKVDYRRLPQLESVTEARETEFFAPRTPIEQALADLWSELLGVEKVGIHDSFFDLGGHSLLLVKMNARLEQQFQLSLPLGILFEAPTVEQLATLLLERLLAAAGAEGAGDLPDPA